MENVTVGYYEELNLKWRLIGATVQKKWNGLLDVTTDDPELLWVLGSSALVMFVYWSYAALYTFMDVTNFPKFLRNYKIQPGLNEPVDRKKLFQAIKVVLINQTIVGIPLTYIGYHFIFKNNDINIRELPSLLSVLIQVAIFSILEEIMFYYVHRLLHHKSVYKYVHKKHHEWTAPIAAITFYCHPIEHVFSNMLPVAVSIGLMRSHLVTAWLFFSIAIVNAMTDHTGYSFPFSHTSVRFHDYHHAKFNYNFGVLGWLDKFHGTFKLPETETKNVKVQQNGTSSRKRINKKQK